jgi:hypothetical protein
MLSVRLLTVKGFYPEIPMINGKYFDSSRDLIKCFKRFFSIHVCFFEYSQDRIPRGYST